MFAFYCGAKQLYYQTSEIIVVDLILSQGRLLKKTLFMVKIAFIGLIPMLSRSCVTFIFAVRSCYYIVLSWCRLHSHVTRIMPDYVFLGLPKRKPFPIRLFLKASLLFVLKKLFPAYDYYNNISQEVPALTPRLDGP